MAPMHEGKVVKPEVFNALPEAMRKEVEHKIEALQRELEAILERMPKADKKRRADLSELNEEVAKRGRQRGARRPGGGVLRRAAGARLPRRRRPAT